MAYLLKTNLRKKNWNKSVKQCVSIYFWGINSL